MTDQNPPSRPAAGRGRLRFGLASVWDILRDTVGSYRTNGDANQAAAIALYAILSIIPLFILTLLLINNLFGGDPVLQKQLIEGIRHFIPSFSGELLTQFARIARKKDLLGWVGIISLIWFSAMIFNTIETALNLIFRSRTYRNYLVSKLLAISMIPLGWAIGMASVGITYAATILAQQPFFSEGGLLYLPALPVLQEMLFRYLLPYLVTVIFFTVVYKVIPAAKVTWTSALVASAIFSALMETAKQFFTWYVASYTRYDVIFGSLEAVVILVVWVFYAALILLFFAELIHSYQRRDMLLLGKAFLTSRRGSQMIDERLFRKFGRPFARNEYVFHEGDIGQNVFYILSGRVRIEKDAGKIRKVLAEMGPGQYFGEMAALIGAPRTTSAVCLEPSHIAILSGEILQGILREDGDVSLFMLRELSNRIRHTNEALDELTQAWIRLTAVLYFFKTWPLAADRNPASELAELTGRETDEIREVLTELDRRGVLSLAGDRVTGFSREKALGLIERPDQA